MTEVSETSRPARRRSTEIEPGTTVRMTGMRKLIAARMTESLQTAAQLTAVQEVDVTSIVELRSRSKAAFAEREGVPLTFLPFFARALLQAVEQHPKFNASIDAERGEITYHAGVDLGLAVDTPRGLVVPVVREAHEKDVAGLSRAIAEVADRVKNGQIGPDELRGSTITLSNIGGAGSLTDTPILNFPEVAILGTGAIVRRPRVIVDDEGHEVIVPRSVCSLSLTYDHRLIDGADAGRFLTVMRGLLEKAEYDAEV